MDASSRRWTREELLIALNLYHKLTFGQMHARQPVIIDVANKIGRSPNSVAMKLCNLASLDPALRLRGIMGLPGASNLDRTMWTEFHENLDETVPASEESLRKLFKAGAEDDLEVLPKTGVRIIRNLPAGGAVAVASVKVRRGQEYFRDAVLNNFGGCCGVTGLPIRALLVASHILPWGRFPKERLNVRNGLCLSRLHDAAFDRGLVYFDDGFKLRLSGELRGYFDKAFVKESFMEFEGERLRVPEDAVLPDLRFLKIHRTTLFKKR